MMWCRFFSGGNVIRYSSTKTVTYIPAEGVDMHKDANPRVLKSSNGNPVAIITRYVVSSFKPTLPLLKYSTAKRLVSRDFCKRGQQVTKPCKLQLLLQNTNNWAEKLLRFFLCVWRHSGTLSPAFSRNKTACSSQQLALRASVNSIRFMQSFRSRQ